MADLVNLEMSYSTYLELCDAVEESATRAEGFNDRYYYWMIRDYGIKFNSGMMKNSSLYK